MGAGVMGNTGCLRTEDIWIISVTDL